MRIAFVARNNCSSDAQLHHENKMIVGLYELHATRYATRSQQLRIKTLENLSSSQIRIVRPAPGTART